jgi:hypothetical protein
MARIHDRSKVLVPSLVALVFAAAHLCVSRAGGAPLIEPVTVDPGSAPAYAIESLDGAGREISANLLAARSHGARLERPEDLIAVPGIGARRLHAWHADLVFSAELP